MKNFFAFVILMCLYASLVAEPLKDDGGHSFDFLISNLVKNGFKDEIYLYNGSSYEFKNVKMTISVNGKSHELFPIFTLKPNEKNFFDGIEDNEMHDELKYIFGKDGKLDKSNSNTVVFHLDFNGFNDKVFIKEYHIRDKKMYFYVEDKN